MKVLFLVSGGGGAPVYGAYANRILSMAKGLTECGADVELLIVFNGMHNLTNKSGIYEGVRYRYCVKPQVCGNRLQKTWLYFLGILRAMIIVATHSKKPQIRVIACFHGLISYPIWTICWFKGIPVIRELNEFPASVSEKGESELSVFNKMRIKLDLVFFKGFIVISTALHKFLASMFPGQRFLVVPIIVQPENFSPRITAHQKYITYVGAISNLKDGLPDLIDAFYAVNKIHPDVSLKIVGGDGAKDDLLLLKMKVSEYKIEKYVCFTGMLSRRDAIEVMRESYILTLPRPDNNLARGGFPTKLGEYLATGIPVVATSVGDIPLYLTDRVNAFLAQPSNVSEFTSKLLEIIEDYPSALKIAEKGKEIANTSFNNKIQAGRMQKFLAEFRTS